MTTLSKGIFITGTDTSVGKTVVAAALVCAFRARGLDVGVMKPAESGCGRDRAGSLIPEDALFLKVVSGSTDSLRLINPYALESPLAPALAADLEHVEIRMETVTSAFATISAAHQIVVVEGAGGLLVPLTNGVRMLDLARILGLPLLVVARNVLGVINHADLTVRVAEAASVPVAGIVLNNPTIGKHVSTNTNAASLQKWVAADYLGELPYLPSRDIEDLRVAAEKNLKLDKLLKLF